ncbi:hypothetical protein N9118_08480 [Akkermansiaceae bacterium]|jgi:hypothetical protein|nr:hypothetical protein [Akkermansiaceae bacterium]
MFLTHLFQGVIEFIRAGLAAADMEGGEKGAPCSRVTFKKRGHGLLAIHDGDVGCEWPEEQGESFLTSFF